MRSMLRRLLHRVIPGRKLFYLEAMDFASGLGNSVYLLYGLVRSIKPNCCVEIGSASGRSTCFIAEALDNNRKGILYAIDPHEETDWNDVPKVDTYRQLQMTIDKLGYRDRVVLVRDYSENVASKWDKEIDLLFIDGDHTYEGVKKDWEGFKNHVAEGGVIVFHDTIWERMKDSPFYRTDMGVPRFVDELRKSGYPVVTLLQDYGVSIVQNTKGGIELLT